VDPQSSGPGVEPAMIALRARRDRAVCIAVLYDHRAPDVARADVVLSVWHVSRVALLDTSGMIAVLIHGRCRLLEARTLRGRHVATRRRRGSHQRRLVKRGVAKRRRGRGGALGLGHGTVGRRAGRPAKDDRFGRCAWGDGAACSAVVALRLIVWRRGVRVLGRGRRVHVGGAWR